MTQDEFNQYRQAAQDRMAHERSELLRAYKRAQESQRTLDATARQQYAVIVAVDEAGGFSKDGQIPWHYPEDFKWFKDTTAGHICVMGRTTYNDINDRLGDKAAESVLPGRRCFVVTSSPLPRSNATAVSSISEVDQHVAFDGVDNGLTVFFIGGEGIYREGIAKANVAYVTIVNKDVEADKFFPVDYMSKYFELTNVKATASSPELRFTTWRRKPM